MDTIEHLLHRALRRLRAPFNRARIERDMSDEMELHVRMEAEELMRAGIPEAEARRRAAASFGGIRHHVEEGAAGRGTQWLDAVTRDARFAARSLRRSPVYAVVGAATLALGIGATTLIFSLVNGVLLTPLPYAEPERLVRVWETPPGKPDDLRSIAHPTLDAWKNLRTFEAIALYGPWSLDLADGGRAEQLEGVSVSSGFLQVMGTMPALGRGFSADEYRPGGPKSLILSDALWRRRFGGDPAAIGRSLTLDRDLFTIVGVMPPAFAYPAGATFWVTTALDHEYDARQARHLSAIGRLRTGATVADAAAELATIERRLGDEFPGSYKGYGVRLQPLFDRLVGQVQSSLLYLLAAVGALLLIACANVANLALARASNRRRELVLRTALGAKRSALARLMIVESLVLAGTGGAAGIAAASATLGSIRALGAGQIPRIAEVSLNGSVLTFAILVTVGTGLLVSLLPILHVTRRDLQSQLREGGAAQSATGRDNRARSAIVVAQTALALVLLSAAGLLIRSFARLAAVDPGVRTSGVLTFHIGLPPAKEQDQVYVARFYRELRDRLAAIPGVTGAALASRLPLSGEDHSSGVRLVGDPPTPGQERSAQDRAVSPDYFRTLGIRVRGREFTDADNATAAPVAMINETFARRFFPGRDPLNEFFVPSRAGGVARQIVGIAGDAKQFGVQDPVEPEYYLPHPQDPWPWLSVVMRVEGEPRAMLRQAEGAVWSLDPTLPLTDVRTMDEMLASTVAPRRLALMVIGSFAMLALILATIGTYGVMSYLARERQAEVGIRMAIGATPAEVRRLLIGRGLWLGVWGLGLGAAGSVVAGRALRGALYGVAPFDPATLALVLAVLGGAVLMASWLPARRAARTDPVRTLRGD